MKIFYIDTNNFPSQKIYDFAKANNICADYKSEQKLLQHYCGLYLFNRASKNFYNMKNPEIFYKKNKPYFKNYNDLYFSISHSKNIVGIAFDNNEVGFDIEFNQKERNFYSVLKRFSNELYDFDFTDFQKKDKKLQKKLFYDFWTKHEAKIKLNSSNKDIFFHTNILNENFTYTIASEKSIFLNKIIVLDE